MKIGVDLHGVLDRCPQDMKIVLAMFMAMGFEVAIISGPPREQIEQELGNFGFFCQKHYTYIISVVDNLHYWGADMRQDENGNWWTDEETWWDSKARICLDLNIDYMIDDSEKYAPAFSLIKTKFIYFYEEIVMWALVPPPQLEPKPNPESHAPMNAVCEKCGRIYCDHENKY